MSKHNRGHNSGEKKPPVKKGTKKGPAKRTHHNKYARFSKTDEQDQRSLAEKGSANPRGNITPLSSEDRFKRSLSWFASGQGLTNFNALTEASADAWICGVCGSRNSSASRCRSCREPFQMKWLIRADSRRA